MIYIKSFSNYEEFKEVFGFVEHGNGTKSRKNKILLGALKDRRFIHFCLTRCAWKDDAEFFSRIFSIKDAATLKAFINDYICKRSRGYHGFSFELPSVTCVYSSNYRFDVLNGICEDMDTNCVRYYNIEREKVFKMKAGKFITQLIEESCDTAILPEQIKRWIGEEFAREWKAYAESRMPNANNLELYVGDCASDFADIYDGDICVGDFGSCMTNNGQYEFYVESIDASAACLRNDEGDILARCIIYNEVHNENTGEVLRLAERQYSKGQDNVLKQILVDKLIKGGYIDGYKRVGASCHDSRDFVYNDGSPLTDRMWIKNTIREGDTLSYQDTFKWLDQDDGIAYNHEFGCDYIDLATTDSTLEESHDGETWCPYDEEWICDDCVSYDDYHEEYIYDRHAVSAMRNGDVITVDNRRLDDFRWSDRYETYIHEDDCTYVDGEDDYYFDSDVIYSDYDDEYILKEDSMRVGEDKQICKSDDAVFSNKQGMYLYAPDAYYSDITEDYYDSEELMLEDEKEYRASHAVVLLSA